MLGAAVVVDSRGGAPATVNTDALRLGYDKPRIDAIVFSGGAVYGEEAVTALMTGLKDEGVRSGARDDRARATGAVINDLDGRRLNEIYPDKRLAQATLEALRPGVFPLGAQGAGRMAMQGRFFGCRARSGQGAAFREINGVKIAAFVVVNAFGSIVDRQATIRTDEDTIALVRRLAALYPDAVIAGILNRQGRATAYGHRFEAGRVGSLRRHWKIPCFEPSATHAEGEPLTIKKAAAVLGVAPSPSIACSTPGSSRASS